MKKIFLLAILFLFIFSCGTDDAKKTDEKEVKERKERFEVLKKEYEIISADTLPVIEIRGFHCLCGLNKIYPGFLLIPLNLATSTG